MLWILNTGAQWHMLPQSYPNYKTVHRRFRTWCREEVLRRVLMDVANELRERGALDEEECFIDATFVMAKGGGAEIGTTKPLNAVVEPGCCRTRPPSSRRAASAIISAAPLARARETWAP